METDQQSFEGYVRARTAALSRIAYLLTGDHYLAEDLVQQTLFRVAGRWHRLQASGDPDPYVRKVLYHQHVSWWRRAGSTARVTSVRSGQTKSDTAARSAPDVADQVAITITVRHALAKLSARQRAALILRYFEDLTEVQTADVLGCRVGTVKSHVREGLARLRVLAPELADLVEAKP